MARVPASQKLVPSIIDRLISRAQSGSWSERGQQLDDLKRDLRRDLEDLLNTRCQYDEEELQECGELGNSLLAYGVPDFTGINVGSDESQHQLERRLESIIQHHEPRLTAVEVRLDRSVDMEDRILRLQIKATLIVRPDQKVMFMSDLEALTGTFAIRGGA